MVPSFPYPPDVRTDLRTLFRQDRRGRRSRDVGASSITRGEGSLDLLETDDGPTVGRYGDLPDGSFGVGVVHRGQFWNVSDLIGQGQDHDAAQDGRLDGHAQRLGSAEGRLDGAEGRLDDHASRLGSAEGRLDSHAGRLGNAEGRLDDHAGRIGATESKNTQQDSRLDSHASRIGATEGDIGDAVSRLNSHASRIGAAEGRLDDHAQRIGAVENRISAAEDKIALIDDWLRSQTPFPGAIHPDSRYFLEHGSLPP